MQGRKNSVTGVGRGGGGGGGGVRFGHDRSTNKGHEYYSKCQRRGGCADILSQKNLKSMTIYKCLKN
jgi:hypothetical protein